MFLFRDFTLNINKEIRFALMQIFGIGLHKSNSILSKLVLVTRFLLRI